jgi:hypothetical protein
MVMPLEDIVRVGLISDTHGLLRRAASAFLEGSDCIIHAGDIGDPAILEQLATLAPVTVVRGNNDTQSWAREIPETAVLTVQGIRIYVLHDLATLSVDVHAEQLRVVVAGHSHRPGIVQRDGVTFINPGSAGRRRFKLPIAAGEILIRAGTIAACRTVELPPGD